LRGKKVVVGFEFVQYDADAAVKSKTPYCKMVLSAWQGHYFPESQETSLHEESLDFNSDFMTFLKYRHHHT
jgi:hypothetical protein